jgi:hypothetical protein
MTTKEKDAVREMMETEGWKIFVSSLREREHTLMENLISCKPEEVPQGQAQIKAIREIVMKAKTLVEGGPNGQQE